MKQILGLLSILLLANSCNTKEVKWDATGSFEATEVIVSSQSNGIIEQFKVQEGDKLTAKEVVGYVDTTQLYLKKLQLLSSQKGTLNRKSDISKQIAATEQQIKWQKEELQRFQTLFTKNAATQKQLDDIQNQIYILQKQLEAQRSTLSNSNQSINAESSAIEIQVAQIEDQIKKSYITSPINGNVLNKYAEEGEFTAAGKPLFTVADIKNLFIRAYFTGDLLTLIKLGQEVKVYSDFGKEEQKEYSGKIVWISDKSQFTPKNIQTRDERANMVYAVKIAVKNDGYLKIGMYGEVKL